MSYPTIERARQGIRVLGHQIGVEIIPHVSGLLSVSVIGMPALTGWNHLSVLTSFEAGAIEYQPDAIQINGDELRCLAVDKEAPQLRTGLILTLETGMDNILRARLPKLALIASASQAIHAHLVGWPESPALYLLDIIPIIVARIVLDSFDVPDAIMRERNLRARHGFTDNALRMIDGFHSGPARDILDRVASGDFVGSPA